MTASLSRAQALADAAPQIGRREARELLLLVCACSHAELIARGDAVLAEDEAVRYADLVARCAAGEPLAYLLGSAWFAGREFAVSPAVLIPRPDTEVLVEQGLAAIAGKTAPRLVDLGTGSGIVAVTLALTRPDAEVSAVDISPAALDVARSNAARLGATVRFLAGDWFAPLAGECFDLIVSNPPYVAAGDPHLTRDGLPFEPQGALTDGVSGGDGMACIAHLVAHAAAHLTPGGALRIEHGYDQAVKTRTLLLAAGFTEVDSWRDGAGIERVSGGRWPAPA
ncbi:MAG: peptide chain release factor N(5)-glutamine methyltransferase [Propionivibrio sp.]